MATSDKKLNIINAIISLASSYLIEIKLGLIFILIVLGLHHNMALTYQL